MQGPEPWKCLMGNAFSLLKKMLPGAESGPVWRGGPGDLVVELYEDARIAEISPSADRIIGAQAGRLTGRSFYDFVRREDRSTVKAALAAAFSGDYRTAQETRAAFRLLRLRRAPALAEISFEKVGPRRIRALIRDRGEDLDTLRDFRAAAEKASSEVETRADMMADLGHEMKTPLNAIIGFADTMRAETFGPLGNDKYRDYADLIHASGGHLMDLIGSILDFAKLESGRYQLEPALNDPAAVTRECAEMIRQQAEKAGLALRLTIEEGAAESFIDVRALRQILLNLLTNAVKFTSDGEITIGFRQRLGVMEFTVKDTGVGMSEQELAKLGARYTEAQGNGVRGASGTGLGLSLAFGLAELQGGKLKLTSAPGEGLSAVLMLPVVTDASRAREQAKATSRAKTGDIQSQLDRVAQFRRERADAA